MTSGQLIATDTSHTFFQTALDHIRAGRHDDAQALLNGLSEPNETCLGLSKGRPAGNGVSGKQALDLYNSLADSQAAQNGLLSELADCDLFVEGIGTDKISDITTNIIRRLLVEYTHEQCKLHNIELVGTYPSGRYWSIDDRAWQSDMVPLPVVGNQRLILVPKFSVRHRLSLDAQEYYSHHVLNFIQQEEFERGSPLVRVLKSGERRPPTKKDLRAKYQFSKDFLARFSEENPAVLERYKNFYRNIHGAAGPLDHDALDADFDENLFSRSLIEELRAIEPGNDQATRFHHFCVGALEFIFWPNAIYPTKEQEIHQGRKRIDISFTNASRDGFFHRVHTAHNIGSNYIIAECKNYSKDPANPELDQLSGRFSANRGRLGLLLYRSIDNYERLIARCHDTAQDGRGVIIPIGDDQLIEWLELIAAGSRPAIDQRLEQILQRVIG